MSPCLCVAGDLLVQVLVRMGPTSQLRRVVAALLHNHAPLTQVRVYATFNLYTSQSLHSIQPLEVLEMNRLALFECLDVPVSIFDLKFYWFECLNV